VALIKRAYNGGRQEVITKMEASDRKPAPALPVDPETIRLRQELEDIHEELLLLVMSLQEEWLLDDRIAYSVSHSSH
jgi:hypothetical protein